MTQNLAIQFHVLTATRVGSGCLPRLYCQWSWRVVLVRLSVLESIHLQAHCCFGQIHGKLSLIFFFSSGLYRTSARLPGTCPTVVASCSLPFVFIIFTTIALCECARILVKMCFSYFNRKLQAWPNKDKGCHASEREEIFLPWSRLNEA